MTNHESQITNHWQKETTMDEIRNEQPELKATESCQEEPEILEEIEVEELAIDGICGVY